MSMYPKFQGNVDNMSNNPYKYFLNNHLENGRKPAKPGDYVHVTTWQGMYKVHGVDAMFFVIRKNNAFYRIPWEHLKCNAGRGGSNQFTQTRHALEQMKESIDKTMAELRETRRMYYLGMR